MNDQESPRRWLYFAWELTARLLVAAIPSAVVVFFAWNNPLEPVWRWSGIILTGAVIIWLGLFRSIRGAMKEAEKTTQRKFKAIAQRQEAEQEQRAENAISRAKAQEDKAVEAHEMTVLTNLHAERQRFIDGNPNYFGLGPIFRTRPHLFSESLVSYVDLRDALAAREWEAANRITWEKILQLISRSRDKARPRMSKDLEIIPRTDILTMDRLWAQASTGNFGLTRQVALFREAKRDFSAFCTQVAWEDGCPQFSSDAPAGHLPNALFYNAQSFLVQLPKFEKETVPANQREYDPDWYEDRLTLQHVNPLGTTVREKMVAPGIVDPTRGFITLIEIMERYGW